MIPRHASGSPPPPPENLDSLSQAHHVKRKRGEERLTVASYHDTMGCKVTAGKHASTMACSVSCGDDISTCVGAPAGTETAVLALLNVDDLHGTQVKAVARSAARTFKPFFQVSYELHTTRV